MSDEHTPLPAPQDRTDPTPQDGLLHPAHQVFFRAGLIACREYMARFVEAESPSIANSIRANWWPALGSDFGPPRKLYFAEVTSGEFGTPEFRVKTAEEVSPTQEALPIALGFLEPEVAAPARGHQEEKETDMEDIRVKEWNDAIGCAAEWSPLGLRWAARVQAAGEAIIKDREVCIQNLRREAHLAVLLRQKLEEVAGPEVASSINVA